MSTKILCVDDDPHVLAGYQRGLRKQFTLDTALGGEAGLELLWHEGPFAVVVADMNMPGMNGIEFIKEVRTLPNYKFMPILFLTTESQQSKRLEAKAAGASGWLVKPATADELLGTIKLVIR